MKKMINMLLLTVLCTSTVPCMSMQDASSRNTDKHERIIQVADSEHPQEIDRNTIRFCNCVERSCAVLCCSMVIYLSVLFVKNYALNNS